MGRVLEDGGGLRPRDKLGLGGKRVVGAWNGGEASEAREGCRLGAIRGQDQGDGGPGAADPAGVLGEKGIQPLDAVPL